MLQKNNEKDVQKTEVKMNLEKEQDSEISLDEAEKVVGGRSVSRPAISPEIDKIRPEIEKLIEPSTTHSNVK